MLNSMTGFSSCVRNLKGIGQVELSVRSVNHRFLEVLMHLPEEMVYIEDYFREVISRRISRGRITCALKLNGGLLTHYIFDEKRLKIYFNQLKSLNKKLNLKGSIDLGLLLSLPGVIFTKQAYKQISVAAFKGPLDEALEKLISQRQKEGRTLYEDLSSRVKILESNLKILSARFKKVINQKVKNFALPEEKSAFLKNADITEELVRMRFHAKNLNSHMKKAGPSGKELDFIAQELMREANTVGAKSIDAVVSGYVVRIKSEIEKIREQVQNVE